MRNTQSLENSRRRVQLCSDVNDPKKKLDGVRRGTGIHLGNACISIDKERQSKGLFHALPK